MATKGKGFKRIEVALDSDVLSGINEAFRRLPAAASAEYYERALRVALKPALEALRQLSPVGPTGNLRRAVDEKYQRYPRTGSATGMVGYRRSGKGPTKKTNGKVRKGRDRAYHQFWIEEGTDRRPITKKSEEPFFRREHVRNGRTVKGHWVRGQGGYIASSFNSISPKMRVLAAGARQSDGYQSLRTDPPYPQAFFMKRKEAFFIRPSPKGGRAGVPPLQAAFDRTRGQMQAILERELAAGIQEALLSLATVEIGFPG